MSDQAPKVPDWLAEHVDERRTVLVERGAYLAVALAVVFVLVSLAYWNGYAAGAAAIAAECFNPNPEK